MNPYAVLGVKAEATSKEVTAAFRRLAMRWHPDRHADSAKATAELKFKEINAAYAVLSDPSRRAAHDQAKARPRSRRSASDTQQSQAQARTSSPKRGVDIKVTLTIPLEMAIRGGRAQVSLHEGADQQHYQEQANTMQSCPQCAGSGMLSARSLCSRCAGRGYLKDGDAATRSRGASDTPVFLPKDLIDGSVIRLREMGHPGQAGGYSGDLFVKIRIAAPEGWKIKDADMHGSISVTRAFALQGGETTIRLPHGLEARVEVPPGTPFGTTLKIARHALYDPRARIRGDVYLRVKLDSAGPVSTDVGAPLGIMPSLLHLE